MGNETNGGSREDRARAVLDDTALGHPSFRNQYVRFDGHEVVALDVAIRAMLAFADEAASQPREGERITRGQYPEIIQAARWMDEDNGTPHFEPGVGFVVDDPDGLTVPMRWIAHLPTIEAALAGLDHSNPHPLDVDTLEWLAREGKEPTLYESAVRCFVSGEHTPMTAMAESSEALWIASRFFNERFEGWDFDPTAGYHAQSGEPAIAEGERGIGWVAWNPDSGEEYTRDHPVRSGECVEAERVRPSTPQEDVLWQAFQDQFMRAEALSAALAQSSTPPASPDDDLEQEIADAIDDSLDMDWTGGIGARHVMDLLRRKGIVS